MSAVIKVNNLSKRYYIGKKQSGSLRETLSNATTSLFSKNEPEEFWALKDVSFEVQPGEVLGIIGKNGAGKSTLLKILSRITDPTEGSVEIEGRVSSLLEVGTGFHPELTGRENIFMNGAILGMRRAEIRNKFDEIVAFSGIEQFIDTPVKRYSSGMYVRLAFAVAAHLEPEILIIDEVLAVGDAEFQKKCLGKMKDVSEQDGRTVIFVSHNMTAVKSLCNQAILLKAGRLSSMGDAITTINNYQMSFTAASKNTFDSKSKLFGNEMIAFNSIEIESDGDNGKFYIDKPLNIHVKLTNKSIDTPINVNLFFNSQDGTNIFAACSMSKIFKRGEMHLTCRVPANFLNDNVYLIDAMAVTDSKVILILNEALVLEGIEPPREAGWLDKFPGVIRPSFDWIAHETINQ